MSSNIITGRKIITAQRSSDGEDIKTAFLYDQKSVNAYSKAISIDDGQCFKLSTFNLPDGYVLTLLRVMTIGGSLPVGEGCSCGDDSGNESSVLASEVFKIDCKPVVLDSCNSVLYLNIPGTYVLQLSDEEILGDFFAVAEEVSCECVPTGLLIGNVGLDKIVGTYNPTLEV